ncbi:cytochrome P450 [Planomonospora parontospora]|uniref:cytochrome P450 n=1 Tax=Planomonospora parontospora TaxID=58119 RepID=UPI0019B0F8CA|nr:cytochrome P450 [Planomonospora parontospora]GGL41091.1 cytochrome P450 [Planomonospora parontospora subsp. antibiotica]GII17926.1 cytochrome P450 [Planomonospora parontospora subsp. antibiotica]
MTSARHRIPPPAVPPGDTGPPSAVRDVGQPPITPLYGPEFAADPHEVYDRLRRSRGPVAPVELAPGVYAWLVLDYYAALEVLRSPHLYSKDPRNWRALACGEVPADSSVVPMMGYRPNALFSDQPAHSRYRQAITDSLARVDPHVLHGSVARTADRLIDAFAPRGQADLLGDYAAVLPVLTINALFGQADDAGTRLLAALAKMFEGGDGAIEGDALFTRYMVDLIGAKRAQPGPDVTSWLMAHPARLSDEEMIHQCTLLIAAGTEPVQNLIGNALWLLLADDRFAGNLSGGTTPVDAALEEVLWLDPPMANYAVHYPRHDVALRGVPLRAGDPVVVSLAAANTDPKLNAATSRVGNRAHLAFSAGPHACPAKDPSRLIATVAIERLLDRLPDVRSAVAAADLQWRQGPFHRALTALPVHFTPVCPPVIGEPAWTPPPPAPTASTPPAPTSTARPPASAPPARRRWWNFRAASRHGR